MKRTFLLVFILMLNAIVTIAQDTSLIDLLATVPDTLLNRESWISYVDFRAMEQAHADVPSPQTWAEYEALDEESGERWFAALLGARSGPDIIGAYFTSGAMWEETIGFDFFAVNQALAYSQLPENAMTLAGDFNLESIATALSAREFTSETLGDFQLWCGVRGCDQGDWIDFEKRNLANPFGGELGKEEPLLVSEQFIMNSPDEDTIQAAYLTATGEQSSLAENANYVAVVNSIPSDNLVIQAQFIHPSAFLLDVASFVLDDNTEALEELMASITNLPQYNLVFMADTATETEQVVYITLVYNSLDDAEIAVEEVPTRLELMLSTQTELPYAEMLTELGVTDIVAIALLDEETEQALAIFEFHAPLDIEDTPSFVFRPFVEMLFRRDMNWLAVGAPDS